MSKCTKEAKGGMDFWFSRGGLRSPFRVQVRLLLFRFLCALLCVERFDALSRCSPFSLYPGIRRRHQSDSKADQNTRYGETTSASNYLTGSRRASERSIRGRYSKSTVP